ncbi:pentapeptide repeat-containing protein [Leisingera aquaemixtae]|uniref:Secreted effector protein PipB2 n=1 Tax=Leisingera aquaemixtae TaxID=1396826 RepID=A0A0P1H9F3_9RHOB|nr:pentapeptide repeat-containing protein [Leisingera aquaemixtae]CUH99845.1 hypothetical protein PHA8399_01971 [Leisingera aquaemixtae]
MRDENEAPEAPAAPQRKLTPANENPWYVLMTLYGEQEGEEIDVELSQRNRQAWNAWASKDLPESTRDRLQKKGLQMPPRDSWNKDWDRIKQSFEREFCRRNPGARADFSIFESQKIDLKRCSFSQYFDVSQFVFPRAIELTGSHFSKGSTFEHAAFSGNLTAVAAIFLEGFDSSGAVFLADATFKSCRFAGEVNFSSCSFLGKTSFFGTYFKDNVLFSDSDFVGWLSFEDIHAVSSLDASYSRLSRGMVLSGCSIGEAYFSHINIEGSIESLASWFNRKVSFQRSRISGDFDFFESSFGFSADFSYVSFRGFANFPDTSFSLGATAMSSEILFSGCSFEKPANFSGAKFQVTYPVFQGTILHD